MERIRFVWRSDICSDMFPDRLICMEKYTDIDIRQYGSGNAGTTNALRTLGAKGRSHHAAWEICFKCVLRCRCDRYI